MTINLKISSFNLHLPVSDFLSSCLSKLLHGLVTKTDLDNTENRINMNLTQIKEIIAEVRADHAEAFGEINTKITAMQTKIDELVEQAGEFDDPELLEGLEALRVSAQELADIVPDEPVDPAPEPV